MIAKVVAVNAVAVLLLAVMSYALSALLLRGVASFDAWLDPSRKLGGGPLDPAEEAGQPSQPARDRLNYRAIK